MNGTTALRAAATWVSRTNRCPECGWPKLAQTLRIGTPTGDDHALHNLAMALEETEKRAAGEQPRRNHRPLVPQCDGELLDQLEREART